MKNIKYTPLSEMIVKSCSRLVNPKEMNFAKLAQERGLVLGLGGLAAQTQYQIAHFWSYVKAREVFGGSNAPGCTFRYSWQLDCPRYGT